MKEVRSGKTYEEIYGKKRSKQIRLKQREINLKEKTQCMVKILGTKVKNL